MSKDYWARSFALCILLTSLAVPAAAQTVDYPHKNVTLIPHSGPGRDSNVFLRELAKHLGPVMGANFAVENVCGGSGAKAMAYLAEVAADGAKRYATTPTYIQTSLLSKPDIVYSDLDPIANVFFDPQVTYTRADAP